MKDDRIRTDFYKNRVQHDDLAWKSYLGESSALFHSVLVSQERELSESKIEWQLALPSRSDTFLAIPEFPRAIATQFHFLKGYPSPFLCNSVHSLKPHPLPVFPPLSLFVVRCRVVEKMKTQAYNFMTKYVREAIILDVTQRD